MTKIDFNDDSAVVIIGSGAGGGTLANELCQKGVKVVVLEAGALQSQASFVNDEWKSFGQIAWLDARTTSGTWRVAKDFAGLPAWICKTVGGTTTHWAGASLRLQAHEFKNKTMYGDIKGTNQLDWPVTLKELEPYYAKAEDKMGDVRGCEKAGLQRVPHGQHGDQQCAAPRPRPLHAAGLLLSGLQERREVEHAVHRVA
jgi:choline dehydrogenase-like flavoprotein